jgi:hypothetical protein
MEGYWLTTRPFSDDMAWSIEETQKGLEVNGLFCGRFGYSVGIVEGFGNIHSDKDFYGHMTYKLGGLPLDGVTEGGPSVNNSQPYIDNSLTLGAFVYRGSASLGDADAAQGNTFTMGGGDINLFYDRFNLFGGVGLRHDETPFLADPLAQSANTTVWFSELDMVVYPWFLPGVRVESWHSQALDGSGNVAGYTDMNIVPGIVFLVRPNVKLSLRTSVEKFDSRGDSKFDVGQVIFGTAIGM